MRRGWCHVSQPFFCNPSKWCDALMESGREQDTRKHCSRGFRVEMYIDRPTS
ncbi:hypothetical protein GRAN_5089 [Granulicella sibirica]|uniref:Uncharacterized protein n=1 Tax=Granulicella sibirica TaxID=2479048 RepID=A0A4Q0SX77_9BACT|nr:hypothetical protein GRAN_5089 [Granulicella sibirica]